jgi:phosphatidylserine decarboxylase
MTLSLATTLPLAWKWGLGVRRAAVVTVSLGLMTSPLAQIAGALVHESDDVLLRAGLSWLLTVGAAAGLVAYRFYRDPERAIPPAPNVIVSPADGEVVYVRESRNGSLPTSTKGGRSYPLSELTKTTLQMRDAAVIGIAMTLLDVHVNRAPIAGRIAVSKHVPGLFGSLRRPEMILQNERMTTVIQHDDLEVGVVQIASRLVRQIVSFVHESEDVARGQRIGMIRFGSQVDLVLPLRAGLTVTVKPGDRLRAGESIVARHQPQRNGASVQPPA